MAHGRGLALALLASTQLLLILDTAIINVALPSIGDDLGTDAAGLSLVANAYLITFGGFLLLAGRIADLVGHRRLFTAGLALLSASSLGGAFAGDARLLVAARALQGVGAACAAAAAFALVLLLFAEGPERHRALGVFAALGGLGGALGTVLGGVLTSGLGWRSTFVLNVLVGVALIALTPAALGPFPAHRDRTAAGRGGGLREFDLGGALTATGGLSLIAYALVDAGSAGWTGGGTLLAGTAGLLLLAAFAVIETRAARPLVPPGVLGRPTLRLANILSALAQMALFPMFFLVSLYLQNVLGYAPVTGGLGLLPLSAVVVLTAPRTGWLVARFGLRPVMTAGFATVAAATVWLALSLSPDGSFATTVLAPSLLIGIGLPLVMVTTNIAATAQAGAGETGLVSGLVNTSQQFGSVLGLAVLVAVAAAHTRTAGHGAAAETAGFRTALLVGAAFAAAATLLTLLPRAVSREKADPTPSTHTSL
ncbi:MFS transporter [Streptomyces sp. H39-S7]|uniref:MFS transporter n=1 Tax=Streptomyces sp. H39-S7 TaxID=3004357 RepID=UPI0022AE5880|nr:MFS transporter [Streptomyces sp. H39-S7]MCZ4121461.1 MFS transporter [Streptomyces sp. H39-S7]